MDERIQGYVSLIESLAQKYVGRNRAEYDDLVQEGMVNVWQTLERGVPVRADIIERRMLDWVRLLGTQMGRGRGTSGEAIEYATLLPMERILMQGADGMALTLGETLTEDPIPLPGHDPLG
jgi:DNA-directed RNA polymerase specialized sigma24 family protein